jgi:transketolase
MPAIDAQRLATPLRVLAMDAVEAANSGHPGMPMGMADVAAVLFGEFLHYCAQTPEWPDRDRFVLSAGHGSMLLYSLGYLLGYPGLDIEDLKRFRQWGSHTAGHPEYHPAFGIETTTGPLGQGLANAVGLALGEQLLQARFGEALVNHRTYTIVGDGCLMEGIAQEAITLAGHLKLHKLTVLFDDNSISIDGKTTLSTSEDTLTRFRAAGWNVEAIDGHNATAIRAALNNAQTSDKPSLIACKTTIAYGAPTKAGTAASHGSPLGKAEIEGARAAYGWSHPPFEIPADVLQEWRSLGRRGEAKVAAWTARLNQQPVAVQAEFERALTGTLPAAFAQAVQALKASILENPAPMATRKASGNVLDALAPIMPDFVGGSADLTGSNNTKAKGFTVVEPGKFKGQYLHYGVREHAMAAVMNGLALHKGMIPFGGTFLVFSDYCKPSLRLAALMQQRVIYVFTHDSIGLGEDGPTHQPIEHLAALRAIPGLLVFRPADAMETAECWELALTHANRPSVLALTRQDVPLLRTTASPHNRCAAGAYRLREPQQGKERVTLLATGSEVSLACTVQDALQEKGVASSVVSMPSWELFNALSAREQEAVIPEGTLKVAIEAASPMGWHRYTGRDGLVCALDHFGASAPYQELYQHFGLTAATIVPKILAKLA